jgi:hypothetical protein
MWGCGGQHRGSKAEEDTMAESVVGFGPWHSRVSRPMPFGALRILSRLGDNAEIFSNLSVWQCRGVERLLWVDFTNGCHNVSELNDWTNLSMVYLIRASKPSRTCLMTSTASTKQVFPSGAVDEHIRRVTIRA